eukprot:365638-Chlamydomonas_euryale.AAC.10
MDGTTCTRNQSIFPQRQQTEKCCPRPSIAIACSPRSHQFPNQFPPAHGDAAKPRLLPASCLHTMPNRHVASLGWGGSHLRRHRVLKHQNDPALSPATPPGAKAPKRPPHFQLRHHQVLKHHNDPRTFKCDATRCSSTTISPHFVTCSATRCPSTAKTICSASGGAQLACAAPPARPAMPYTMNAIVSTLNTENGSMTVALAA